jgi:hypothetical protein
MSSGYTFGALNDYAMSFQMNDDADRGFWWGDTSHTNAQGAMSLTTNGHLAVANTVKIGYGESDTSGAAYDLDVSGNGHITGSLHVGNYVYHDGDTNTYMLLQGDQLRLVAGGRQMIHCDEGTDPDKVQFVDANNYVLSSGDWAMSGNVTVGGEVTATSMGIGNSLYHVGDTDTYLQFGTNTITLATGGSSEITVNTTGVRLGDTGNGYFQPVSGNYGSIQIDGGAHGGYEGYNIGGRAAFLHNNSTESGISDDVNNAWMVRLVHGGAAELMYSGNKKIETTSTGITVTGDVNSTSDIRYKKNIEPIDNALEKVQSLNGVTFDWDNDAFPETEHSKKPEFTERATGVIAQDVEKVLPEAVRENEDGFKNVAYGNMVGLLIEAIKEQQTQIDELKAEVAELKG